MRNERIKVITQVVFSLRNNNDASRLVKHGLNCFLIIAKHLTFPQLN
jgi:hypothetical protein